MAIAPTATVELASLPTAGGGTIGIYRVTYDLSATFSNAAVAGVPAYENLASATVGIVGRALGLPAGMTILNWTNDCSMLPTDQHDNVAANAVAIPTLVQSLQRLVLLMSDDGSFALADIDRAATTGNVAIVIATSS